MPTADRRAGWRKSTFSAHHNGCVEVDFTDDGVEIRDDKITNSPVICFDVAQWKRWLDEISNDDLTDTNGAVTVTTDLTTRFVHHPDTGATLAFTEQEWTAFRLGILAGEFTPSTVLAAR